MNRRNKMTQEITKNMDMEDLNNLQVAISQRKEKIKEEEKIMQEINDLGIKGSLLKIEKLQQQINKIEEVKFKSIAELNFHIHLQKQEEASIRVVNYTKGAELELEKGKYYEMYFNDNLEFLSKNENVADEDVRLVTELLTKQNEQYK